MDEKMTSSKKVYALLPFLFEDIPIFANYTSKFHEYAHLHQKSFHLTRFADVGVLPSETQYTSCHQRMFRPACHRPRQQRKLPSDPGKEISQGLHNPKI
jgi:hypothetical protein